MTRLSSNRCDREGNLIDGFDYQLQVWVRDGIVETCGHRSEHCGCNGRKYGGQKLADVRARISAEHWRKFFAGQMGRPVRDGKW